MKKHNCLKGLFVALLSLIMVLGTCTAAFAATLTYSGTADTLQADGKCYAYVMKSEEGGKIKASATPIELSTTAQSMKELGFKDGTAAYLYVVAQPLTEDIEEAKPNFIITAPIGKKAVGSINYTKADAPTSTDVLSTKVTDNDNKKVAADKYSVLWSDGEAAYEAVTGFTGAKLAGMLENGGTVYIKIAGTASNVRLSKAYKVKVAKQAKAPKAKIDVKKSSISLGNGYDFALVTKTGETYSAPTEWKTILPYLKDATRVKEVDASIIASTTFTPLAKKADTAKTSTTAYTAAKIKALGLDVLAEKLGDTVNLSDGFSIAVRKSATDTKPASAVAYVDIKPQTDAPQMYTLENTSSYNIIASDAKFSLKAGKIVNYTSAWDATKIGKDVAPAAAAKVDDAAAKYEMAVVKYIDINDIDWSTVGWKSIKEGTKITEKTKTSYYLKGSTTKVTAILKKIAGNTPEGSDTVVLVRRAGVKGKTASESVPASAYLTTYVKYDSTAKVYNWISAGEKLVGGDAYTYTVTYLTWNGTVFANDSKLFPAKKYYAATDADAVFDLPEIEGYTVDTTADDIGATFANNKFKVTKKEKDGNADVKIRLKKATKVTIKYVVPTGDEAIPDAEVDAFLGYECEITDAKLTNSKYIDEDRYTVTVTGLKTGTDNVVIPAADKTVVTVTFAAKAAD